MADRRSISDDTTRLQPVEGGSHADTVAAPASTPNESVRSGSLGDASLIRNAGRSVPAVPGFEILGELGHGGMGVVFLARQLSADRLVALKVVRSAEYASAKELARFRAEARAIARLDHPHVVRVFEVGEANGLPFFSLEYCPGGSLAGLISGKPWKPTKAASVVEALARGAHAAHLAGIVHRDLKPGNVLLAGPIPDDPGDDPPVKLTDFGLAKASDETGGTSTGAVMGTPAYMAPEQADGRTKEAGPEADVYALGAILYELLAGRQVFRASTAVELIRQVIREQPSALSRHAPVPRALEAVCLKCLEKDPRRRYPTAEELADELRRFRLGSAVRARKAGQSRKIARWARHNPLVAALMFAVAGCMILGTAFSIYWAVRAQGHADRARQQTERAVEARADADAQLWRAEWVVYSMRLKEARQALDAGDFAAARQALDETRWDFRGWEFAHLEGRLAAGCAVFPLAGASGRSAAHSGPGGRHLAYGTSDGGVIWLDLTTGKARRWRSHLRATAAVAIRPDGKRLASCGSDVLLVQLRALVPGLDDRRLMLDGELGGTLDLSFDHSGARLVVACSDKTVRAYDGETLAPLWTTGPFLEAASKLTPSADGRMTFLAGGLRQIDAATGKGRDPAFPAENIEQFAFDADASRVALCRAERAIELREVRTGKLLRTLAGLELSSADLCFDPSGDRLIEAGGDRAVRVWDLATGTAVRTLRGHTDELTAAHPVGDAIVSLAQDGTARVWPPAVAPPSDLWKGHVATIDGLETSPDGRFVVSTAEADRPRVWDLSGKLLAELAGHHGDVNTAEFGPAGDRVVTAGADNTVRGFSVPEGRPLWSATLPHAPAWAGVRADGKVLALMRPDTVDHLVVIDPTDPSCPRPFANPADEKGEIRSPSLDPAGDTLALSVPGGEVLVLDAATGGLRHRLAGHADWVYRSRFLPGNRLATASADKTVRLWDLDSGQELDVLRGHSKPVRDVVGLGGGRLATTGEEGVVIIWDAASGTDLLRIGVHGRDHNTYCGRLAAPAGGVLLGDGADGTVQRWHAPPPGPTRTAAHTDAVIAVPLPGGRFATTDGRLIQLWDAATGRPTRALRGSGEPLRDLAALPDGRKVSSAGRTVTLWDADAGRPIRDFAGMESPAWHLAASHDGRIIVAAGPGPGARKDAKGELVVWDGETGVLRRRLTDLGSPIHCVAVSPDGSTLAAGNEDGLIRLWSLADGAERGRWQAFKYFVLTLAFSPDGRTLAAGDGADSLVALWDVAGNREFWRSAPLGGSVKSLAFAPDGGTLAAGDFGGRIHFLDPATGVARREEAYHAGAVLSLAFTGDSTRLLSGGTDGRGYVLDLPKP